MIEARSVNHIGIAVRSLDAHRDYYERVLGAAYEGTDDVPSQHVRVAFYRVGPEDGGVRIELLEPTSADSPVAVFIEKRGEGVHHIAYTVDGIEARLRTLRDEGLRLVDETPRPGAHHTRIAFLHPKSSAGVLTELVEPAP
ncbi:MAG TPA: methylmalonyl-CoA epimerase [Longimicrobiales bacterium]|nr:methylmalonyl-CoA epimerase [Longimicrobiales bacterium]